MPPIDDDGQPRMEASEPSCKEAPCVVVFKTAPAAADRVDRPGDQNDRDDQDQDRDKQHNAASANADDDNDQPNHKVQKLRLLFTASSKPPIVTFRLKATVFGLDSSGKTVKATLHFDVPRHHISSLTQVHCVDLATVPELGPEDATRLGGGVARIQFRLHRPGNLILPTKALYQTLRRASQETLATMRMLAAATAFDLLLPRTVLSQEQIQRFQQRAAAPMSDEDRQQEEGERAWWLSTLYGGTGGQLPAVDSVAAASPGAVDSHEAYSASDSGQSTIATATPPAYRESALSIKRVFAGLGEETGTDAPPLYTAPQAEGRTNTTGSRAGKRSLDLSPEAETRIRRRLYGAPGPAGRASPLPQIVAHAPSGQKQPDADPALLFPAALILAQLEEVFRRTQALEEENRALKTEMVTMREQMDTKLQDMAEQTRKQSRTLEEVMWENDDLGKRLAHVEGLYEDLEGRHDNLVERQMRIDDTRDWIEQEHSERVRNEVRDRLIGALETM